MTARVADYGRHGDVEVRRWVESDADALRMAILGSIEHLRPYMPWTDDWLAPSFDPVAIIAEWTGYWETGGELFAGIFVGGEVVGSTGLRNRVGPGKLEVGYWLAADRVGRGVATVAAGIVTDLAFRDPLIEAVQIIHEVSNARSAGVPRRLGYRLLGTFPGTGVQTPVDYPACIWEVSRADWAGYASRA